MLLSFVVASLTFFLGALTTLTYPYFDFDTALSFVVSFIYAILASLIVKSAISVVKPKVMIKALVIFWFLTPLLVAVPFSYFSRISLPNAYFEMVSGLTGTGLTVVNPSSESPLVNAIRAASQWTGEVGALFLTLILAIVFHVSPTGIVSALGKGEKVRPSMYNTLIDLIMIYIILTIVPILYMLLAGMNLYDSLVYTFAALATGGFAPTNGGTADLNFWQQLAVIITCILGGLNFSIYLNIRYKKFKNALSHPELKMMIFSIFFYAALLLLVWKKFDPYHVWSAIFHSASSVTTSGFQIQDVSKFGESAKFIITVAMIIGASAFSTGGGIKLYRAYVLGRALLKEIKALGTPRGYIKKITVMDKEIPLDDLATMFLVALTYIFTLFVISLIITEELAFHKIKIPIIDVIFEVASAMSGTGLSSGLTGVAPTDVRLTLAFAMIVGKLEVLPVLFFVYETLRLLRRRE